MAPLAERVVNTTVITKNKRRTFERAIQAHVVRDTSLRRLVTRFTSKKLDALSIFTTVAPSGYASPVATAITLDSQSETRQG